MCSINIYEVKNCSVTKNVRATLLYSNKHSPSTIYIYYKHRTILGCEGNIYQSKLKSLICCVFLMWHVSAHIHEVIIRPMNGFLYISRNICH